MDTHIHENKENLSINIYFLVYLKTCNLKRNKKTKIRNTSLLKIDINTNHCNKTKRSARENFYFKLYFHVMINYIL